MVFILVVVTVIMGTGFHFARRSPSQGRALAITFAAICCSVLSWMVAAQFVTVGDSTSVTMAIGLVMIGLAAASVSRPHVSRGRR